MKQTLVLKAFSVLCFAFGALILGGGLFYQFATHARHVFLYFYLIGSVLLILGSMLAFFNQKRSQAIA